MNRQQYTRKSSRRNQIGQGMTEYIIIVALIAVAAIGIYGMFGDTIRAQMGAMTGALGGSTATANAGRAAAVTATGKATAETAKSKGLNSFEK